MVNYKKKKKKRKIHTHNFFAALDIIPNIRVKVGQTGGEGLEGRGGGEEVFMSTWLSDGITRCNVKSEPRGM